MDACVEPHRIVGIWNHAIFPSFGMSRPTFWSLTGILDLHFGVVVVWFTNELIDEWALVTKQCHCYENAHKHHTLSTLMMRTYSWGQNKHKATL